VADNQDALREVQNALACLSSIRRRGSTTAAIAGANAGGAVLLVHDAHMMGEARQMGALRVQTISALRYGNPRDNAPIVVDHHAAVVLVSRAVACAELEAKRADEEKTRADQAERDTAAARHETERAKGSAARAWEAARDIVGAARKVVETDAKVQAEFAKDEWDAERMYQAKSARGKAIDALAAELAKLDALEGGST
jgi:hypothetical protein